MWSRMKFILDLALRPDHSDAEHGRGLLFGAATFGGAAHGCAPAPALATLAAVSAPPPLRMGRTGAGAGAAADRHRLPRLTAGTGEPACGLPALSRTHRSIDGGELVCQSWPLAR